MAMLLFVKIYVLKASKTSCRHLHSFGSHKC